LFIFPPNGPHGCVTITARFDLESDICAFELDSGRINFRSLTDGDDDDADDGIVLKLKFEKARNLAYDVDTSNNVFGCALSLSLSLFLFPSSSILR
jgi:hypothetical protein